MNNEGDQVIVVYWSEWRRYHGSRVTGAAIGHSPAPRSGTCASIHTMGKVLRGIILMCCFSLASFTDPGCVIELECRECVPDNMPLVTSHRAVNGSVSAAAGDEVVLACAGGRFLLYPLLETVTAVCEAGRYRARHDAALRHLLELGCQENVFEDVLQTVEHCAPPLQGRAYRAAGAGARAVGALCFDADRARAAWARAAAPRRAAPAARAAASSPLSLLGNFNHMFDARTRHDAERLYSDDVRLNRRLHELLKYDRFSFADQTLTSARLLSRSYFEDQNGRVADFVSNSVAAWRGVAAGNLRHLQRDVARLLRAARPRVVDVYAGTHGVMSLRVGAGRRDVYLAPGRFPVPKYVWTVVHDTQRDRALALVVLNDPFVAVSEIRGAVFCESQCGRVAWLHELRRHRNYESPVYGLVFCCAVHNFTDVVSEMPKAVLGRVPLGDAGMFIDSFA
ncbi:uncharacterized protein LOC126372615 [Pectinophora gossypiella]|uniref:uncharacterized protein LOC126372615 n=1 Tax=Pectinophora gossypiella TaxID=13191 RepID=UPI00214EA406|nr:uncharacterized protein LOC126372615 [Pectinophora gossypiella]